MLVFGPLLLIFSPSAAGLREPTIEMLSVLPPDWAVIMLEQSARAGRLQLPSQLWLLVPAMALIPFLFRFVRGRVSYDEWVPDYVSWEPEDVETQDEPEPGEAEAEEIVRASLSPSGRSAWVVNRWLEQFIAVALKPEQRRQVELVYHEDPGWSRRYLRTGVLAGILTLLAILGDESEIQSLKRFGMIAAGLLIVAHLIRAVFCANKIASAAFHFRASRLPGSIVDLGNTATKVGYLRLVAAVPLVLAFWLLGSHVYPGSNAVMLAGPVAWCVALMAMPVGPVAALSESVGTSQLNSFWGFCFLVGAVITGLALLILVVVFIVEAQRPYHLMGFSLLAGVVLRMWFWAYKWICRNR